MGIPYNNANILKKLPYRRDAISTMTKYFATGMK